MKVLIVTHPGSTSLRESGPRLVRAARTVGDRVELLVIGEQAGAGALADQAAGLPGVDLVHISECTDGVPLTAESAARHVDAVADGHGVVMAAHGALWRAALARLAGMRSAPFAADVVALDGAARTLSRPVHAGNAMLDLRIDGRLQFMTVRAAAFAPWAEGETQPPIAPASPVEAFPKSRVTAVQAMDSSRPELASARIVLCGGRGLGSAANMELLGALADGMNAAMGASRAAVDAGYAPNALQVGQTGKSVAPDLYMGFGISGAIQHLAGIKDSRLIVAVNKDADAPIFSVADYGLVADLFDVLPRLQACFAGNTPAPS